MKVPYAVLVWIALGFLLLCGGPALAQETSHPVAVEKGFWEGLLEGFLLSLVYGVVGIFMAVMGFKIFDWITPRIDIQRELAEKHNIAVAIVCAAIILGVCLIVMVVVR